MKSRRVFVQVAPRTHHDIRLALSLLGAGVLVATTLGACQSRGPGGTGGKTSETRASAVSSAASASQIVAALQAQPGSPVQAGDAQGFTTVAGALQPQFAAGALAGEPKPAHVSLPQTCTGALHLEDAATGAAVDLSLTGALPVAGQIASGYLVYPGALPSGGTVLHRPLANGVEDFVSLPSRPATPEVDYTVALGAGVAGLRLVAGNLEFIDAGGVPRLRVLSPYIVGADGTRTDGALAVANCAVDTDASAPWGRPAVAPGAGSCTLRVTWPDALVTYPAILDPRWTTTGSMGTARFEHTLVLLSTGRALVAGGRSTTSGTTGLTSAELYDQSSGTWAATGSMSGGRRLHSATQLPTSSNPTTSGKILVAGGISGSTSLGTFELYSPTAGTFATPPGNLNTPRHAHTATLLVDGRVLVAGGMNGTTTIATAALYNPASGAGSWVATIGPIPPAGLKSHTATLIQTSNTQLNNHVLLVGGNNGSGTISSVYLFDPVQNAFSTLASIPSPPREQHTALMLPNSNGKILVAGGKNGSTVLATAIVFDPSVSNGTWSAAGTMTSPRVGHTMTLLPNSIVANGQVLVAGGSSTGSDTLSSAELFSDSTTWTATPSMPGPLQGHQAVLLGTNMVLAAGGLSSTSTVQTAAYLYDASFGLGCSSNSQCPSGFCTNGVCCNSACNSGTCGACNIAGHLGTCTAFANGTVCRASAGACDVAETCNGSAFTCPADGFAPSTTVCRAAAGECDLAENCTGSAAACPSDAKKASGAACTDDGNACTTDKCDGTTVTCQHAAGNAGSVCRASAGACDVAETCTGSSTSCPADSLAPSSTVCRAAGGECDLAENCTGSSASCPADTKKTSGTVCTDDGNACTTDKCDGMNAACQHPAGNAGTVCRASAGACDVAETCTGTSTTCPTDGFVSASTVCRVAAGECDLAENCTGSSASCPADTKKTNGTACTDDGNLCTKDQCDGSNVACQHPAGNAGTVCRVAAGECDLAETCTGTSTTCPTDTKKANGTACTDDGNVCTKDQCDGSNVACQHPAGNPGIVCRTAAGECDLAETCTGSSTTCPADAKKTNGTVCTDDGNVCTLDQCDGSNVACQHPAGNGGTVCRTAAGECDLAETCTGSSATCPADAKKANGTVCTDDGNVCTRDQCDGSNVACQHPAGNAGTVCRASAGICDVAETCTGTSPNCPLDNFAAVSTVCRPSAGPCDVAESCTGASAACPTDAFASPSTVCRTAADQCDVAENCTGSAATCPADGKSANGTTCNDGNACTIADACQSGSCVGNAVTCTAQDQCHAVGSCNPSTGACSNPTKSDGTSCDDGNSCTSGDSCVGGSCTPGNQTCTSIAITVSPNGGSAQPQLATTLTADVTEAVPGDVVSFTSVVTNTGTLLGFGFWSFSIQNNGSAPFLVKGYQQTLEYFSVATQAWVPFAKLAYDAGGNPVPITDPTLTPMQWAFVFPNGGNNVTYGPGNGVVGTSIDPGGTGTWSFALGPIIPPDVVNILFNPAEASDLRAAIRFDVPSGPPAAPGAASFASALPGVTGEVDDLAVQMHFPAPNTLDPDGTPMTSLGTGPLAPGASRTFTTQRLAPPMLPRDPGDTDAVYLGKLNSYRFSAGYATYASPTGHSLTFNPFPPNAGLLLGVDLPIVTPQKSGPATSNAGLTQTYTVALANSGNAVAGPFSVVDSVDGSPISGTVVTAPNVPAGTTGNATVAAPSPLARPAGPMTDTVAVTWQDRNGTSYGPVSSSFTTNLAPGHPEGYLSIAGATSYPDMAGTPKTLTAKALDPLGNPAPGVAVQIAITGVNPQTTTLTTGTNGTATFTYAGPNLGNDTLVASGTITTTPAQSAPVVVTWATSVGTPCTGRATPLDVVFVIDGSSSMQDEGKLVAAEAATDKVIGQLSPSTDQVGGVVFRGNASLALQLTGDLATAKTVYDAAIEGIASSCGFCNPGTNIPEAITVAVAELTGPRHRPGATPVMIFLSDGGNTGADPAAALALLKASGVRAISISLGSDIDTNLMTAIASSKNDYFYSPTATELDWAYSNLSGDLCRNPVPLVAAGGNQSFYEVRLPDLLTLNGEVHDVNGVPGDSRLTTEWTFVSGPGPVTFTDASSPVTEALFAVPGTYVLQLEATDGFLITADRATVTVDPDPSIVGANLAVALGSPGPLTTGGTETLTATLTDGLGAPISNFVVQLTVAGANPLTSTLVTNASGVAVFTYQGGRPGTDLLHATAIGTTLQLDSATLTVQWTEPASGGPVLTQGWIASPLSPSTVTGQVPIVLSPTVTLASGTVTYWPTSAPAQVHTVVSGVSGAPSTTIATFDTTLLANGTYIVKLDGTNDAGDEKVSEVAVTVSGDYKPGRVVVEVTDLSVPVAGLPITVGRRYDSLEKDNVGDFGQGWSLTLGHPKLDVDPAHNVTLTMPDGRRVTFYLAPTSYPFPFRFLFPPTFVAEPGVFGQLTSDGCDPLVFVGGSPTCFLDISSEFAPTNYTYTDPYGRQFAMAATGELKSIKDRQGNTLTFAANGIISGAGGLTVQFVRDTQGRITKVLSPPVDDFGTTNETDYAYDAAGDLESVTLPPNEQTTIVHYAYDPVHPHLLKTTTDPRGNAARTSTYDSDGRLAKDTDAMGNATTYTYDLPTRTTHIKNPDTGEVTQVMDERGLLLSETDPLNRTTTHEHDANRNETKRTNALGEVTTTTYDDNGNPKSVTDALLRTSYTTYDAFSNPTSFKDRLQHLTTIAYDDRGLPTSLADEVGTRFSFTSSEQGVPLTVDDAAGNRAYLTYDTAGNVTSRTDWLGRVTRYTYDGIGQRLTETSPGTGLTRYFYRPSGMVYATQDPATVVAGVHGFDHDQNGNVITDTWPVPGHVTHTTFDPLNHVTLVQYGDGTTTGYTRDFRGNKLSETDELGRTTNYDYDLAGQLLKTTFPDLTFTIRTYDALGRLKTLTDERHNTTSYEYDPGCGCSDRVTKVTDPLNRATTTAYDALGRRSSTTDAAGRQTHFAYDVRNHLVETDFLDDTSIVDVYDPRGRRTSSTDQTHALTTFGYDDGGQLTSLKDALGHVTGYGYDLDGNLASVTDANGHTTAYEYDLAKRKIKRTLPLGQFERFAYDAVGNQTSHTDFRGKTTTRTFDARDRMLTKVPDASLGEPTVSYTYFPTGTRSSMTDASGATTYTYDDRYRLLTKATPAGTLTYTYDLSGNLATIRSSNANGTSVDYLWDAANELASVTDNSAGGLTAATYTATGRRDTMGLPNGVGMSYGYDPLDRVASVGWKRGTSSAFASWAYGYNGRGQRISATDATGRQVAYGYDAISRLTSETITNDPRGAVGDGALTYTLDPVANRLTRGSTLAALGAQTFAYDPNDQLTSDGYDTNGNTTNADGHAYAYDFENRLISKDAGLAGAVTIVYDGDGNRIAKTVDSVTTRYLVDDLNPSGYLQVTEEVSGAAVQTRYTFGTSVVSQTRNVSTTPATSYYGYDAHGNITFLTDATGAVTDTYDYDAWGNIVGRAGTTPNMRLYAGEEFDPDLGLVTLRARYYAARTGRFFSIDPMDALVRPIDSRGGDSGVVVPDPYIRAVVDIVIPGNTALTGRMGLPAALHRYLYGDSDPVDLRDPTGLATDTEYSTNISFISAQIARSRILAVIGIKTRCWVNYMADLIECAGHGARAIEVSNCVVSVAVPNLGACLEGLN